MKIILKYRKVMGSYFSCLIPWSTGPDTHKVEDEYETDSDYFEHSKYFYATIGDEDGYESEPIL